MTDDLPHVAQSFPLAIRLALIAVGLFVIGISVWELWPGLWPPNGLTVFFGIIVAGACSVGSAAIAAGLFGEDQRWAFPDGRIVVTRQVWRREWQTVIDRKNLVAARVELRDNSDGPDTWGVVLQLADGVHFRTQGFDTPERAENLRVWLMAHVGVAVADSGA